MAEKEFISWRHELNRAKTAWANRQWDAFFQSSVENSREMRTTFTKASNILEVIEWLEAKAFEEESGSVGMSFSIGGL